MIGPTAVASQSVAWSSEVRVRRGRPSSTRFGTPASTAGRKNELPMPATPASTTIAIGVPTNGSARRRRGAPRSAVTISRLRESRSTSGPATSPTTTDGRNVAIEERR